MGGPIPAGSDWEPTLDAPPGNQGASTSRHPSTSSGANLTTCRQLTSIHGGQTSPPLEYSWFILYSYVSGAEGGE